MLLFYRKPLPMALGLLFACLEVMNLSLATANPIAPLSETEIQQGLLHLPGWTRQERQLQRTFTLKNFVEAIAFVNQLVEPSEKLGHHPDILILYNRVTITLSTHDAGGLTSLDFALAQTISQIAESRIGDRTKNRGLNQ